MRYFLFFSILIMATSFDSSKQELKNNPIYLETISKAEFDAIKNKSGFRMNDIDYTVKEVIDDLGSVKRDSLNLVLNLSNGKKLVFTNKTGDDHQTYLNYTYIKSVDVLDSWLISEGHLEEVHTLLVNKKDGKIQPFYVTVLELDFSPNMSKMISWSGGNEMVGDEGHLSYYKINNKSLELQLNWDFNVSSEDGAGEITEHIHSLKWENDSSIVFSRSNEINSAFKYNRMILK